MDWLSRNYLGAPLIQRLTRYIRVLPANLQHVIFDSPISVTDKLGDFWCGPCSCFKRRYRSKGDEKPKVKTSRLRNNNGAAYTNDRLLSSR